MDFNKLTELFRQTNKFFKSKAISAVNTSLTLRNWLFGFYIVEYEQKGEDKAAYGDKVLNKIVNRLKSDVSEISLTYLKNARKFYLTYPQIGQTVSDQLKKMPLMEVEMFILPEKGQTASDQLQWISSEEIIHDWDKRLKELSVYTPSDKLVEKIPYSHFVELIKLNDPLKRIFYEIESINGTWSVRELKRQIATLYYERSGLSKNKEKLHALVNQKTEKLQPSDILKNPFTFEFLGLPYREVLEESELEQALIDNLQQFLLELGNGFCFEARQKRILIGGEYYYIDLVFYHRILRCHILVDLKVDDFSHEYAGQLNTYVNYYKKEIKQKSDRNPVGILLCTGSNNALVEYATAGMNKNLFISEYMINLPSEKELKDFITRKMQELK
ncbi:MAG: PDDEXK nuclease domain-containing protein [Bacteroidales bacterium]|nr:PDDEXK nuclease domain-containing protein [Bacteroidales bacterium]